MMDVEMKGNYLINDTPLNLCFNPFLRNQWNQALVLGQLLASVVVTFHILIFSSETPWQNELKQKGYLPTHFQNCGETEIFLIVA
jgi:hypothetical protein